MTFDRSGIEKQISRRERKREKKIDSRLQIDIKRAFQLPLNLILDSSMFAQIQKKKKKRKEENERQRRKSETRKRRQKGGGGEGSDDSERMLVQ